MSWSIFGRLFWKVWREDWKRWASVLAVGAVAFDGIIATTNIAEDAKNSYLAFLAYVLIIIVSAIAARRGQVDSLDGNIDTIDLKIPSIILVIMWASVSALLLSVCMYAPFESSFGAMLSFYELVVVATSLIGYALGQWTHPWLTAILLYPVYYLSFGNYFHHGVDPGAPLPYPAFTELNVAVVTMLIVILSLTLPNRCHKRIPTVYQVIAVIAIYAVWISGTARNNNLSEQAYYSGVSTADYSIEVMQTQLGEMLLYDYKIDRSFTVDMRKQGDWDSTMPVKICRGKYVLAIASSKKTRKNSIIRWNYLTNRVNEVVALSNSRYYTYNDIYSVNDDGAYMVIRLKPELGNGCEYWLYNNSTNTLRRVLVNANPEIKIDINNSTATFIDQDQNTARILDMSTAMMGPRIGWMGGNIR